MTNRARGRSRVIDMLAGVAIVLLVSAACASGRNPATRPQALSPRPSPTPTPTAAAVPVLGYQRAFSNGEGWGTVRPASIYDGGDPGGLANHLVWRAWGQRDAYADGQRPVPQPNGGYYNKEGRAELRATGLAMCHGKLTYTKLFVRSADRPGGPLPAQWTPWWPPTGDICQVTGP